MEDLTTEKGQKEAVDFFRFVRWSMENRLAEPEPDAAAFFPMSAHVPEEAAEEPEEIPDEVKEARKAFGEKLGFYCFRKGIIASRFSELIALDEKELKDILNGNTNTPSEFHMINIVKLLDLNASERKELMELDARGRVELSVLPKYYEKYIRKAEIIETLGILAEADIDGFEVANALQSLVKEAKKKLAR
jgi:hypothetical protein